MHYTAVANAMHDLSHGFGSARTKAKADLLELAGHIDELTENRKAAGHPHSSSRSCVESVGSLVRGEGQFTEELLGKLREALETLVASIGLQETAKKISGWLRINGEPRDYGWTAVKKLSTNQTLEAAAEFDGDNWSMLIVDVSVLNAGEATVRPRIVLHAQDGLMGKVFLFNDQNLNRPIESAADLDYVSEVLNSLFESHLLESA